MSESFRLVEIWMRGEHEVFYFLILTDSLVFKYLVSVTPPNLAAATALNRQRLMFDAVPLGDWNIAYLRYTDHGYLLGHQEILERPPVGLVWHPNKIDILDFPELLPERSLDEELSTPVQPHKSMVTLPQGMRSGSGKGVAIWTWDSHLHWYIGHECAIHRIIDGKGIAPRFLGHITANRKRTIGYILENVNTRPATPDDLDQCKAALFKLHQLGLAHGYLRRDAFMINDQGKALLRRLGSSYRPQNQSVLTAELASLPEVLQDTSGKWYDFGRPEGFSRMEIDGEGDYIGTEDRDYRL